MTKFKALFLATFLFFVSITITSIFPMGTKVSPLKLAVERIYKKEGNLYAKIRIENVSQRPVIICKRLDVELYDIKFDIIDPDGFQATFYGKLINPPPLSKSDFINLNLGEKIVKDIIFSKNYGFFDENPYHYFDKPGKYTIKAIYGNLNKGPNKKAWTGWIESHKVVFTLPMKPNDRQ